MHHQTNISGEGMTFLLHVLVKFGLEIDEKRACDDCKMTPTHLTSVSVAILDFAFCNAIHIFITFALNVEQAYLLTRLEHVLIWS